MTIPISHQRASKGGYERIITTASRLFAHEGFDATSLRQLSNECGLTAGAIYYYVDSKLEILFEICDETLQKLNNITSSEVRSDASITRFMETFLEFKLAHGNELRVALGEQRHLTENQRSAILKHQVTYLEILINLIRNSKFESAEHKTIQRIAENIIAALYGAILSPRPLELDPKLLARLTHCV